MASNVYDTLDAPASAANPYDALDKANPYDTLDSSPPAPDLSKINVSPSDELYQPSMWSSGTPPWIPKTENPDWQFTKATTAPGTGVPAQIQKGIGYVGNVAKAIPADVAETIAGDEKYYELKNLAGAALGEEPEITQKIAEAAQDAPIAATVAKISQGAAASAPMLALAGLPEGAAKLASLGFSAQMIKSGGDAATVLGNEMGKNPEDRDMDKITSAVSDLSQSAIFAPLAAKYGALDAIESRVRPTDFVIRKLSEQLQNAPAIPGVNPLLKPAANEQPSPQIIDENGNPAPITTPQGEDLRSSASQPQTESQPAPVEPATTAAPEPATPTGAAASIPLNNVGDAIGNQLDALNVPRRELPKPLSKSQLSALPPEQLQAGYQQHQDMAKAALDAGNIQDAVYLATQGQFYREALQNKTAASEPIPAEQAEAPQTKNVPEAVPSSEAAPIPPAESKPTPPVATGQIRTRESVLDNARQIFPFGETAKVTPTADLQSTDVAAALNHANISVSDVLKITSGEKPFPTREQFEKGVDAKYWNDASDLISRTWNHLRTLGLTKEQFGKLIPQADQFKTGKEYYNSAKSLSDKASKAGAGEMAALVRSQPPQESARPTEAVATGQTVTRSKEQPPSEPGMVGMGGAIPEEFKPSSNSRTKIANNAVDNDLIARGLEPAMATARRANQVNWDKAMRVLDDDPDAAKKIYDKIKANPDAPLEPYENEILKHKLINLKDEYNKLMDARAQAFDDAKQFPNRREDFEELNQEVAAKGKELEEFSQIDKKAGAANARGLQSRSVASNDEDFTLANARTDFREDTGRDLTPQQEKVVQKKADAVKKADDAAHESVSRVISEISREPVEDPHVKSITDRIIAALDKTAADALARIRARHAQGRLMSGLDPSDLVDHAIYGAAKMAKGFTEFSKWSAEMVKDLGDYVKPHLKQIFDASDKELDKQIEKNVAPKMQETVKKSIKRPAQRQAITLKNVSDSFSDFKPGSKMTPEQVKNLWGYAKSAYIDSGARNFHDIFHGIAKDSGLSVDDVRRGMAQNQTVSRLLNDAYIKQATARQLKLQAKTWLKQQAVAPAIRGMQKVPRAFFNIAVAGHFSTWFGTHAAQNLFDPTTYRALGDNYKKMWSAALSKSQWEVMANDLVRRPNFVEARRAGLNNNPFVRQGDYDTPELTKMSQNIGMGRRGTIGLLNFRQELFDQAWNKYPAQMKTPEMAKLLAKDINHSTGTTTIKAVENPWTNFFLFAPRLISARFQWEAIDPAKAIITKVLKGASATPEEQQIANRILARRAIFLGTYATLLGANAMLLHMNGSKQKINLTNPRESDWLAFKGFGMEVKPFSAGMAIARLFASEASDLFSTPPRKTFMQKVTAKYPDQLATEDVKKYFRGETAPFAGTLADLAFQADYSERPLPQQPLRNEPPPSPYWQKKEGEKPYTWPEYGLTRITPIPLQGIVQEGFRTAGANESNAARWTRTIIGSAAQAATGISIHPDYKVAR